MPSAIIRAMQSEPTSYYGNLVIVSQGMERYGLDSDKLLAQAGVDLESFAGGDQRIPWKLVDRVWALAVEHTGNPCFGLDVIQDLNPALYKSLGIALICSESLRDFMLRYERYFAVISTLETIRFEERTFDATLTDHAQVTYSPTTVGCHSDAFVVFTLKLIRMIYRPDYSPQKIVLAWTPPNSEKYRYDAFVGCPIEYGGKDSVIHFAKEDLDPPLAGANPDLAKHNDLLAMKVLEKLQELDLPTKVYTRILEFLPSGECNREKVAHSLAMSESAFQKKLKMAGTSYQKLLDKTRCELAQQHLADGVSVDEVAYLLGFTDNSNFTRAFKRWLDVTPREFRKGLEP